MNKPCRAWRVESAGLTPLDEERARSMADEGGASAAAIEGEGSCDSIALATTINSVGRSDNYPNRA